MAVVALAIVAGIGALGGIVQTGMVMSQQAKAREENQEMLKMMMGQNAERKEQLKGFMNQNGLNQYSGLV